MSGHSSISAIIAHSATSGVVAGVGSMVLYGNLNMDIMGKSVPLSVVLGAGGALGMLASNLVHDYVLPMLHISDRLSSPVATSLNVGINFVGQGIVLSLADGGAGFQELDKMKLLAEAAGAVIISDFLYLNYIGPMLGITA